MNGWIRNLQTADFALFWLALAIYGVFLVTAILTRAGRGPTPMARFNKLHLRFAATYVVAAFVSHTLWPATHRWWAVADFVTGSFFYFGIHYGFVAQCFALSQASVSATLVTLLDRQGGHGTVQQCAGAYAGGQGFGYIKRSRLSRLQYMLGWVQCANGRYSLTWRGRWMVKLTKSLLAVWGLKQLRAGK